MINELFLKCVTIWEIKIICTTFHIFFVHGCLLKKTHNIFCDKLFKQVTINKRLRVKSVKIG